MSDVSQATITVRRLVRGDASAYRHLRLDALRSSPGAFGGSFEEDAGKSLDEFAASIDRNLVFAAEAAGREMIGTVGMFIRPGQKIRHKAVLFGLFVQPELRGLGVGKILVDRIVVEARESVEALQLSVATTSAAALRLYAAAGFREYGLERRALRIGDTYIDERLMELSLDRP